MTSQLGEKQEDLKKTNKELETTNEEDKKTNKKLFERNTELKALNGASAVQSIEDMLLIQVSRSMAGPTRAEKSHANAG